LKEKHNPVIPGSVFSQQYKEIKFLWCYRENKVRDTASVLKIEFGFTILTELIYEVILQNHNLIKIHHARKGCCNRL